MHLFLWVLIVVELPFDDVKIAAYAFEIVVNLFDAQVPRAQDVLDLPRHEQRFELWGQIRHPVRNVQVAYAQPAELGIFEDAYDPLVGHFTLQVFCFFLFY